MDKIHDLIIIGSGPAGLSAAVYAQRAELDTRMKWITIPDFRESRVLILE